MGVILGPVYAFVDDGSDPLNNGVNWDMVRVLPGPLALLALAALALFDQRDLRQTG